MNKEQFENLLTKDLGWRKQEIQNLFLVSTANENNEAVLKSLILMIYAHWEGFIKRGSKIYLRYIVERKLNLSKLNDNFLALSLKKTVTSCFKSKSTLNMANELHFISKYSEMLNRKFKIKIDETEDQESDLIDTTGNLKTEVFKNILDIIGIEYSDEFKSKAKLIDYILIKNRNCIAHGSEIESEQNEFELNIDSIKDLKNSIILLLEEFNTQLIEAVENKVYLNGCDLEPSPQDTTIEQSKD